MAGMWIAQIDMTKPRRTLEQMLGKDRAATSLRASIRSSTRWRAGSEASRFAYVAIFGSHAGDRFR